MAKSLVNAGTRPGKTVFLPHPFNPSPKEMYVPAGATLLDMVNALDLDCATIRHLRVYVGEHEVSWKYWHSVRPKVGAHIRIAVVPQGGDTLRMVAIIALMVVVAIYQPQIAAQYGATAGAAFGVGVTFVGMLAINALLPPSVPNSDALSGADGDHHYLIQGIRNKYRPGQPIRRMYGQYRVFPDVIGAYTEPAGDDHFLRMIMIFGHGPLAIEALRIGETDISQFDDVRYNTYENFNYSTGDRLTLYTRDVVQDDMSRDITFAAGAVTVTSQIDADELSLDIEFPQGLYRVSTTSGNVFHTFVDIKIEYRITGSADTWRSVSDNDGISAKTDVAAVAEIIDPIQPDHSILVIIQQPNVYRTTTTNFRWSGLWPGDEVTVTGFTDPANNVTTKVTTISDFEIGVEAGLVDEAAGNSITITPTRNASSVRFAARTRDPIRRSVVMTVDVADQYDIKVTRLTADQVLGGTTVDTTRIAAVRTIKNQQPVQEDGVALIEMRIRASGQLAGLVDQINAVCTAKLRIWNGSSWDAAAKTRNPAWAFADACQGTANDSDIADAELDLAGLLTWATWCDVTAANGTTRATFDGIYESQGTLWRALMDIGAAGRASPAWQDDKLTVVRDIQQTSYAAVLTPRNSWASQTETIFLNSPHAVTVNFIDAGSDWQPRQITIYDDGYTAANATRVESIEFFGVTRVDQIRQDARRRLAEARLRPVIYRRTVGLESFAAKRGELIRLNDDVLRVGLGGGKVIGVTLDGGGKATAITLDDFVTMEAGKSYGVQYTRVDQVTITAPVDLNVGDQDSLTFTTAIIVGEIPAIGNVVAFGLSGTEGIDVIVKSITPLADFNAIIECVDEASALHTDDPLLATYTATLSRDPQSTPPQVTNLRSNEVAVASGRAVVYEVRFSWSTAGTNTAAAYEIYIKEVHQSIDRWVLQDVVKEQHFSFKDLGRGDVVQLAVIAVSPTGRKVTFDQAAQLTHTVAGTTPADVTSFAADVIGAAIRLSWDYVAGIDHWRIRYATETSGATYGNATDLVRSDGNSIDVPARTGTYLIKAVDQDGFESVSAVSVVTSEPGLHQLNVVATQSEHTAFSGTHTSTIAVDSVLQLVTSGLFDSASGNFDDAEGTFDAGKGTINATGNYEFVANTGEASVDLSDVYTSRITASVTVAGVDLGANFDGAIGLFDDRTGLFDGEAPEGTNAYLQIATTEDDPTSSPVWSAWLDFVVGDYKARAFKFRIQLTSGDGMWTPKVSALTVTVDMPDRVDAANNITSGAGAKVITFANSFNVRPAIGITAEDMATGDYFEVTAQTRTGFTVTFKNSGASAVSRIFDWSAVGYGKAA